MPSFQVQDQNGAIVKTEDLLGKGHKIVLYTYPKDNTLGCTAEACSFRDAYDDLRAAGYTVIGVSNDSAKSHAGFKEKHSLPFTLLADTEASLLKALGAWNGKIFCGKACGAPRRKTFVFSEDGILERIIDKVDTKKAARQILGTDRKI